MNKGVAAGLLAVGSLLAIAALSVVNFLLFALINVIGLILEIALTVGAVSGITRLRGVFESRFGFSATRFALLSLVPSAVFSGIFFIIYSIFSLTGSSAEYSFEIFAFAFTWQATSAAAVVLGYFKLAAATGGKRSAERLEALLLILALIIGAEGICMYCLSLERAPDDIEGWGQFATGGFGIILIGGAILLALCGGAAILGRVCSAIRQKRDNDKS